MSDTHRSLVYVEGDCSMNKFNDKEGKPTSALSIVQREWKLFEFFALGAMILIERVLYRKY